MVKTLEQSAGEELLHSYSIMLKGRFLYDENAMFNMYKKGAEWQANQMAWININEKMPEDGLEIDPYTIYSHTKNVIVLYKGGYIGKAKRIYLNEIYRKGWQWSCIKSEDITHWMFLPD